jgi:DNA-binding response OmpR family regulator
MRTPNAILVVEADLQELFGLLDVLREAGYDCTGAATYEAGRQLLSVKSFDMLVADSRLGPHNGLHLIRQSRLIFPGMEAIALTSVYDQDARDEARRYGAPAIDMPVERRRLIAMVGRLMEQLVSRRRWVRKRAETGSVSFVNESPASLVDVCYGGVQFEMPEPEGDLPEVMRLRVRELDAAILVSPIWVDRLAGTSRVRCGAAMLSTERPLVQAWRAMVDTLPSLSQEPNESA